MPLASVRLCRAMPAGRRCPWQSLAAKSQRTARRGTPTTRCSMTPRPRPPGRCARRGAAAAAANRYWCCFCPGWHPRRQGAPHEGGGQWAGRRWWCRRRATSSFWTSSPCWTALCAPRGGCPMPPSAPSPGSASHQSTALPAALWCRGIAPQAPRTLLPGVPTRPSHIQCNDQITVCNQQHFRAGHAA